MSGRRFSERPTPDGARRAESRDPGDATVVVVRESLHLALGQRCDSSPWPVTSPQLVLAHQYGDDAPCQTKRAFLLAPEALRSIRDVRSLEQILQQLLGRQVFVVERSDAWGSPVPFEWRALICRLPRGASIAASTRAWNPSDVVVVVVQQLGQVVNGRDVGRADLAAVAGAGELVLTQHQDRLGDGGRDGRRLPGTCCVVQLGG